jgi:hypothetical protein
MRSLVVEQKVNIKQGDERVKFSGHAFDQKRDEKGERDQKETFRNVITNSVAQLRFDDLLPDFL